MSELHKAPIGNALWRAGAGAGKTYNLVERVLRLEEEWRRRPDSGGQAPRLVVTTFTRMATQELRVRLMEAALRSSRQTELVPFVTSRSQLFVTTMHGVMDSFLRTFGAAIGLEPGFRVAGPDEIDMLIRRVGKRVFFPEATDSSLDQSALDEVLAEYGFAQALSIVQRISKLRREFEYSAQPARPAAPEDFERLLGKSLARNATVLEDLIGEIEANQTSEKWNEFLDWLNRGLRLLKADGPVAERLTQTASWLESEPSVRNAGAMKIDFRAGAKWKEPIKQVAKATEDASADLSSLAKFDALNRAMAAIETRFTLLLREEKFRQGLIELEDLEILALELIHKSPDSAKAFADSWDHWLIDEYQDTSPRQVELIRELAQGKPQFVVGDPQQSIYLFRGARPGVFHEREAEALASHHERTELMGNRRSHPDVMAFVNDVVVGFKGEFQKMTSERAKQENLGRKKGSVGSPLGAATLCLAEPVKEMTDAGKEKSLPQDEQRRREAERLAAVASQILQAGASPASIAVLARSNRELGYVAREFVRRGLPIQLHTAGAYSDRLETADLCALLGFLANPHDDENLIHLARTAWFPVDETVLALGYRRSGSLWSRLELESEQQVVIQSLKNALICVRERGIVQAFREVLSTCEFFSWCGVLDPSGRREANALKFISKLVVAERQAGFLPRKFNDEVMGGGDRGGEGESNDRDAVAAVKPDRIHLMTIHVSKGLEFDHVILPFLADSTKRPNRLKDKFVFHETERIWSVAVTTDEEGSFSAGPLSRDWSAIFQEWSLEESRRLLYVALTRARESLFLSATLERDEAPPEESFLQYLRLNAGPGDHGSYRTLEHAPEFATGFASLTSAGGREEFTPPDPWRRNQQSSAAEAAPLVSISVTALLEKHAAERKALANRQESPRPDESTSLNNLVGSDILKPLKMAEAAARGTRLHRVFEMAKSHSEDRRDKMAKEIVRWFQPDEHDIALEALNWVLDLKAPEIASVIASGEVEWSFTYVHPKERLLVEGQVDLWGRDTSGKLWIVDYKTGNTDHYEKALEQLTYYAEALVAAGIAKPGEVVGLAAVFPFAKQVFEKDFTAQL